MGVYADFIAQNTVIDTTDPKVADDRSADNELAQHAGQFDPTRPSAFDAKDAVKVIAAHVATVSGGNFTITITEPNGTTHTTASILYDADEATIESAIDTKMTADSYAGWTNSDISVALTGDLTANAATLTFDGTSVDELNFDVSVTDVDLTGGGTVGAVTTTTYGQGIRYAWAVMWAHGMVVSAPPQGTLMSPATLDVTPAGTTAHWPRAALRKALARQAGIDDDNVALRTQLEALFKVE